jgi:hypothetical protein
MHHGASPNDTAPPDRQMGRRRRTFYSALVLSPGFPFSTLPNRQFARLETVFNFHKSKAVRVF